MKLTINPVSHLLFQSHEWKLQKNVWNLFKVTIKTPECHHWRSSYFCCFYWSDFTHYPFVSIVDIELANLDWGDTKALYEICSKLTVKTLVTVKAPLISQQINTCLKLKRTQVHFAERCTAMDVVLVSLLLLDRLWV